MHIWSVMMSYVRNAPEYIKSSSNEDACSQLQGLANRMRRKVPYDLEFEDYSDEIHAFFRSGGRRRMFASIQYEGKDDDKLIEPRCYR